MPSSQRWLTKVCYSASGQYEGERVVGFSITGLSEAEIGALSREVADKMRPMLSRNLIERLGITHAGMVSRSAEQVDLETKFLSYVEDLSDLPEFALMEAMREIKRTETFFPSSAEIRKLAEAKAQPINAAHTALNYRPTNKPPQRGGMRQIGPRATPEFVAEQMVKFNQRMATMDAEVEKGRRSPLSLKPLHVRNPETEALIEAAKQTTERDVA
jgi:hypothetical protein